MPLFLMFSSCWKNTKETDNKQDWLRLEEITRINNDKLENIGQFFQDVPFVIDENERWGELKGDSLPEHEISAVFIECLQRIQVKRVVNGTLNDFHKDLSRFKYASIHFVCTSLRAVPATCVLCVHTKGLVSALRPHNVSLNVCRPFIDRQWQRL